MRKRIYAIYLCFLLLLTGCGSKKDNKVIETTAKVATTEIETTGVDTEETTEETPTTIEEDKWNVPINYTWNPHVYGDILKELYGEEDEENLYRLIDAVLAGEESCDFDVNNSGIIWDIDLIMQQICPLFDKLVSDYSFEAGVAYFEYRYDKTQHDEIIEEFMLYRDNEEMAQMRQICGELIASMESVRIAEQRGYDLVRINYDYLGVEMWVNGKWKTKNKYTEMYKNYMNEMSKKIKIEFIKVKAHSDNCFNQYADYLAKKSLMLDNE